MPKLVEDNSVPRKLFQRVEPYLQVAHHLLVVAEVLAASPAMASRGIDMDVCLHPSLLERKVVFGGIARNDHAVVVGEEQEAR